MSSIIRRIRIRYALILLAVVSLWVLLYLAFARVVRPGGDLITQSTPFIGEALEASGVTNVPGTGGVLIVDNGRNGQVFWMKLDVNGKQVGSIKAIPLGVDIEDLEGITNDGTYFYAVSSQSRPKAIASAGLVRFKFDAASQSVSDATAVNGLKQYLTENVSELRDDSNKKGKKGGLNIEGLAWDPKHSRLLLGLRSPIIGGQALIVPLKLRDVQALFSSDNFETQKAIRLSLEGIGIRSIEYDDRAGLFDLISGAAEDQNQTDFGLWQWNGDEPQAHLLKKFDRHLKPEGVARVTVENHNFTLVVYDAGGYTVLDQR